MTPPQPAQIATGELPPPPVAIATCVSGNAPQPTPYTPPSPAPQQTITEQAEVPTMVSQQPVDPPPPPSEPVAPEPVAPEPVVPQEPSTPESPPTQRSNNPSQALIDPFQGAAEIKGIDISKWQPNVDWQKVKDAGIKVAYLKASEGKDYVDPTFAEKRQGAAQVGIVTGAYDYARPASRSSDIEEDARLEARHFIETAGIKEGDLVPALDLEEAGPLDPSQLARWARTWLDTVAAETGTKPIVYTSPSFWKTKVQDDLGIAKDYPLWLAHWETNSPSVPGTWDAWTGWQQTSKGRVDGIEGNVDLDVFRHPDKLIVGNQ